MSETSITDRLHPILTGMFVAFGDSDSNLMPHKILAVVDDGYDDELVLALQTDEGVNIEKINYSDYTFFDNIDVCRKHCDEQNAKAAAQDDADAEEAA